MASKAQWKKRLQQALELEPADFRTRLVSDMEEATALITEEFQRILSEFQEDSVAGTFDEYFVTWHDEPETFNVGGQSITTFNRYLWVESPYPNLNVFDILDKGRPALPARSKGESPYPMWSIRDPNLTIAAGAGARRDPRTGRFRTSSPGTSRGVRTESQRFALQGKYPPKADVRPVLFTRNPVEKVEARDLYGRVMRNAIAKARRQGFSYLGQIKIERGGRDG